MSVLMPFVTSKPKTHWVNALFVIRELVNVAIDAGMPEELPPAAAKIRIPSESCARYIIASTQAPDEIGSQERCPGASSVVQQMLFKGQAYICLSFCVIVGQITTPPLPKSSGYTSVPSDLRTNVDKHHPGRANLL